MLTIYTVPRAFYGHFSIIQHNAIGSWRKFQDKDIEILLLGNEPGIEEAAEKYKCKWVPNISYTGYGTPLLSSVLEEADKNASSQVLAYINSDVITLTNLNTVVSKLGQLKFLATGRRRLANIDTLIDYDRVELVKILQNVCGLKQDAMDALDYFIYTKRLFGPVPPLAIGRMAWDNWMLFHARSKGVPVIDVTNINAVVHQQHDYSHVDKAIWDMEVENNRKLVRNRTMTLNNVTTVIK